MHLGGHCCNRVELLVSKGAEKSTIASAADCEVEAESLTAGHERKHNACRAESEVVFVVIPQAQIGPVFVTDRRRCDCRWKCRECGKGMTRP